MLQDSTSIRSTHRRNGSANTNPKTSSAAKPAKRIEVVVQDKLLGECVKVMERAVVGKSWQQLATKGGVHTSTFRSWRQRKTSSCLMRTMTGALRACGKKLAIVDA